MPDFGLQPEGFIAPTLDQTIDQVSDALQALFSVKVRLGNTTVFGQIVAIFCEQIRLVWEATQGVNSAQDPDAATGVALDVLAALTGTIRPGARASTTKLTVTGIPATVLPVGTKASSSGTKQKFATLDTVVLATLTAWTPSTAFDAKTRVTNAGRAYQALVSGTSAGSGGPNSQAADITDNSMHWQYLGEGSGAADVDAAAIVLGPIVAQAGDISVKETAVLGWSSVVNLEDANIGRNVASDPELRNLREAELAGGGSGTPDSIRAALLDLDDVEAASVFFNVEDTTVDGIPPHSIEALVQIPVGADNDQLIFDTLFANVGAGIRSHGTTVGTAVDSEGTAHTMKFTRPEEVLIFVDITLVVDPDVFPSDGVNQVKLALVSPQEVAGVDAVAARIGALAFQVDGVLDVPRAGSLGGTLIKSSSGPTSDATIAISKRQIARYDTTRIVVHTTTGTP